MALPFFILRLEANLQLLTAGVRVLTISPYKAIGIYVAISSF